MFRREAHHHLQKIIFCGLHRSLSFACVFFLLLHLFSPKTFLIVCRPVVGCRYGRSSALSTWARTQHPKSNVLPDTQQPRSAVLFKQKIKWKKSVFFSSPRSSSLFASFLCSRRKLSEEREDTSSKKEEFRVSVVRCFASVRIRKSWETVTFSFTHSSARSGYTSLKSAPNIAHFCWLDEPWESDSKNSLWCFQLNACLAVVNSLCVWVQAEKLTSEKWMRKKSSRTVDMFIDV